ncbi:uncharacterized protein TNCV_5045411 [Trichonephila clavipes]|uniref:Uncharacterized protein n=1 Tax=Trichonephila clavipes TaxID=2585209 RepID=A0A8X6WJB4_TRICX|nr:uncharacterized protein TNCV_5045411 [Trichonephila clavipes]
MVVCGEYSLCRSSVVEWCKIFLHGRELLMTVDEIHRLLGISVGITHTTMHQHLNFRKTCVQWVTHQQTAKQRNTRMVLSLSHLLCYHEEEYGV